jgi:GT2 family glycosyltransferase
MKAHGLPTVIIPIHNAADELNACLASLYRNTPTEAEILLIDDASDDPLIQPLLRRWLSHAGPGWRLELLTRNIGFVGTVNHGMKVTCGHVVLLNSDTVLTPGWLQGLQRCLASDIAIATATPWTNNGEIVSLPAFCRANQLPSDTDAVARIIADTGRAVYPEIPTAVGFCMAISRAVINQLGLFDQELFGLGYGEENDFCMRAQAAGWKNVLCDDVYVGHVGGRSFAPRGIGPDADSMKKLLSRHPAYLELIQGFIAADPLSSRRNELVAALQRAGIIEPDGA